MDWLDKFERWLASFNEQRHQIANKGKPVRWVTHEERELWNRAAATRTPPKTRAQIVAKISATMPMRYARLRRDMKWLEKQAVKHGLSPEDARWLV